MLPFERRPRPLAELPQPLPPPARQRSGDAPGAVVREGCLLGPDGDEPCGLFGNVLSARPGLKKYAALRFRQEETMGLPDALAR